MMKILLILSLVVTLSQACTQSDYDTARSYIVSAIRSGAFGGGQKAATLLRLSFHDCVSFCDGCINMENGANAGLQDAVDLLENVFASLQADGISMSRSDLWAIGGRVGAEWGMINMPGNENFQAGDMRNFVSPFGTFKCGRKDCDTAPYTTQVYDFPHPHMTHDEMFTYFRSRFSLTDDQTVALMGAHTVGRLSPENSGYQGVWLPGAGSTTFNNAFYKIMVNQDVKYTPRNRGGGQGDAARPQYRCTIGNVACGLMLNTDFELFYDMVLDSNFIALCDPTASVTDCAPAATYATANVYAQDNALFVQDFCTVYDLMTDNIDTASGVTLTVIS